MTARSRGWGVAYVPRSHFGGRWFLLPRRLTLRGHGRFRCYRWIFWNIGCGFEAGVPVVTAQARVETPNGYKRPMFVLPDGRVDSPSNDEARRMGNYPIKGERR